MQLPASADQYFAEIENDQDGYDTGYGDAGYSYYGGRDSVYHGDFYQAIDVYIDVNWTPAPLNESSFWIDMAPYRLDPFNWGAEHNFRLTAYGSSVDVTVDGSSREWLRVDQRLAERIR